MVCLLICVLASAFKDMMPKRHELTDEQRLLIADLFPTPQRGGRWADHRIMINGIPRRLRTGAPWRDLPERYGP